MFMGDFNYTSIYWKDNTSGHKRYKRFLKCVDGDFLLQGIEEPRRRGALLDLVLTSKEHLVDHVKVKGSLGCMDHEMVVFKILRAMRRAHSKVTAWDFKRANFGLLGHLLGRVPLTGITAASLLFIAV
ncbi:dtw domain-containing protein 2 [Pitangus sulphuratus]|nr:dtw domain-containing protein 2 [Pitangus sulphuratus]